MRGLKSMRKIYPLLKIYLNRKKFIYTIPLANSLLLA